MNRTLRRAPRALVFAVLLCAGCNGSDGQRSSGPVVTLFAPPSPGAFAPLVPAPAASARPAASPAPASPAPSPRPVALDPGTPLKTDKN
jgi:hypothetical protein